MVSAVHAYSMPVFDTKSSMQLTGKGTWICSCVQRALGADLGGRTSTTVLVAGQVAATCTIKALYMEGQGDVVFCRKEGLLHEKRFTAGKHRKNQRYRADQISNQLQKIAKLTCLHHFAVKSEQTAYRSASLCGTQAD